MYLVPWTLLRQALRIEGAEHDPDATVSMPNRVFRLLVEAALSAQSFDAPAYLQANPDVARSVKEGRCPGAEAHYAASGYYENRPTGGAGFDEDWYLARYPDVQRAIVRGQSRSGHDHYGGPGVREWRSPSAEAEPDIARWRHAVTEAAAKLQASPPAKPILASPAKPVSAPAAKAGRRAVPPRPEARRAVAAAAN